MGALCAAAPGIDICHKAVHSQPQKFQGCRGRGCTPGCGHLTLGLSCPGAGAIPVSWLPNQASRVCWQEPLLLGHVSKPNCLGSGRKPQIQNKHSWAQHRKDPNPNPIGSDHRPIPQLSRLMTAKDPPPTLALGWLQCAGADPSTT
jgi:hypothetical protein